MVRLILVCAAGVCATFMGAAMAIDTPADAPATEGMPIEIGQTVATFAQSLAAALVKLAP
jgi:hypothetical protein